MFILVINVIYVLLAIAMIALILMQRGSGAQAGAATLTLPVTKPRTLSTQHG